MKWFLRSMFAIWLTLLVAYTAFGAVAEEWQVTLRMGSVVQGLPAIGATADAAHAACVTRIPTTAATRTQYFCEPPRYVATVTTGACPAAPPLQTRSTPCPAGRAGNWIQSGVSSVGPLPSCTVSVAWTPTVPRATDCPVTPPAVLAAPASVVALGVDPVRIRVTWNAVPGAAAYQFNRCIMPTNGTCEPWAMACFAAPPVTHGPFQSPGLRVRYLIRASKDASCSTGKDNLGISSAAVVGVAQAGIPNPPDPDPELGACVGTTCVLSWRAPVPNAAVILGYRVVYGRSATEMTQVVQVAGVSTLRYALANLAPGTWFFAVVAYTATTQSVNSNVVSRRVL